MSSARVARRFDQASLTDALVAVGCAAASVLMFALGNALRTVDDQLADLGPDTDHL